jgi:hypothetical protein
MPRMTNWEYMFINLSIGARTIADGMASFYAEVGQAGADGWEAVSEITVNVQAEIREGTEDPNPRLLMLKRPVPPTFTQTFTTATRATSASGPSRTGPGGPRSLSGK